MDMPPILEYKRTSSPMNELGEITPSKIRKKKRFLMWRRFTATVITAEMLFVIMLLIGCNDTSPEKDAVKEEQNIEKKKEDSNSTKETKTSEKVVRREFSDLEKQIYQYMESIWDGYESKYDVNKAEALVFIDASNEFKKPIIEIYLTYTLIQNAKIGFKLTEAEIHTLNMRNLRDIGFKERNGKWYYEGQVVNMGRPLPTPESMRPQKPEQGKKIEVTLQVEINISELKKIQVNGKTNLPDETELMLSLENSSINYLAQDKAVVQSGQFISSWFADASRPAERLANGTYVLKLFTPSVFVLSPSVKEILGEKGRNMTGKLIKFDEVFGNRVEYSKTIKVQ